MLENPASRILSLTLLTLVVNSQGWQGLILLLLPLVLLFFNFRQYGFKIYRLAARLRWFFLSIIILYFWFYPGSALLPLLGNFSPSAEGVDQALLRIFSLLLVISYSGFLIFLTPRDDLISGIQTILSPLGFIGINSQRFALRLGLVLSIVPQLTERQSLPASTKNGRNLSGILDEAARMINSVTEHSNDFDLTEAITFCEPARPGFTDILIPLGLLLWLIIS